MYIMHKVHTGTYEYIKDIGHMQSRLTTPEEGA